ncbi:methylated-DNA-[protein]-cysteine methyltransferase [Tatumella ptyseos ATCC 33301]|uniref:Methylated-DNA-[protein]-cysteine methyltransferase n=1 Tax=Tatumella ptyseos ATCC 33301 TaxID=1005995 RepID=A0A085JKS9_9GAMM|nr:methylated-DNA-[protein]-cysteine methyltransferase [Tatumella ptyseos ATCC 33301]
MSYIRPLPKPQKKFRGEVTADKVTHSVRLPLSSGNIDQRTWCADFFYPRFPAQQISKSANQQISKSANQQISKSANQQISKSANQQISKSANQQISKSG